MSSSQSAVLRLYRSCLRSVKRIPDADQRGMYESYVKDGFRCKQSLPNGSHRAKAAIQDATEQLERMNYYHSIREQKEHALKDKSIVNDEKGTDGEARLNLRHISIRNDIDTSARNDIVAVKKEAVQEWLQSCLPSLYPDDLEIYTCRLVEEGFDSKQMLEGELLEEDLCFMKKAHRRILARKLKFGGQH